MTYIDTYIEVSSIWIAQYFNLENYRNNGNLTYNYFDKVHTMLDVSDSGRVKPNLIYYVGETFTKYYSSFLFQSFDFLARLTGIDETF